MNDANKTVEDIYFNMIMKKTPIERLKMGFSMFESARKIVLSTIKDQKDIKKELFLRFYGNDFDELSKERILNRISNC
ncbi:MAG: hypothetical protein A2086_16685 [Spirochaetes bacterium GWD1_27_9]|nr:MAG: hypothetical protein A2086_16685 [Spirochaetes bacterium GWD1_27_9]